MRSLLHSPTGDLRELSCLAICCLLPTPVPLSKSICGGLLSNRTVLLSLCPHLWHHEKQLGLWRHLDHHLVNLVKRVTMICNRVKSATLTCGPLRKSWVSGSSSLYRASSSSAYFALSASARSYLPAQLLAMNASMNSCKRE